MICWLCVFSGGRFCEMEKLKVNKNSDLFGLYPLGFNVFRSVCKIQIRAQRGKFLILGLVALHRLPLSWFFCRIPHSAVQSVFCWLSVLSTPLSLLRLTIFCMMQPLSCSFHPKDSGTLRWMGEDKGGARKKQPIREHRPRKKKTIAEKKTLWKTPTSYGL